MSYPPPPHVMKSVHDDDDEMHSTFWNSLTLIDHNFGTKSPIELKQKHSKAKISQFLIMLISHFR